MAVNQWRQERLWSQEKGRAFEETSPQETAPHTTATRPEESRITSQRNVSEMRYDRQFGRALDRRLQYRAALENTQKQKITRTDLGTN